MLIISIVFILAIKLTKIVNSMGKITEIRNAMAKNPLISFSLIIGIVAEVSNHNSLFLRLGQVMYADLPVFFAYIISLAFAMFFVSIIISTGFDKNTWMSWVLAFVTIGISFGAYS